MNIEYLLGVFASIDINSSDVWKVCISFMRHLYRHKPRETVLRSKIENLPNDHRSKPICLSKLSRLYELVGNHVERKQLLVHALTLARERGDDALVAQTLRLLADANRWLNLCKEGIEQAKEASEIYEKLGDAMGQARCSNNLARLLLNDGQLDLAEDAASRTIGLIPEKGNEYLVSQSNRLLGDMYHSKGEKEKAIHRFQKALEIASRFDRQEQLC